jgi:type I restriction enzyme S subunit
MSWNIVKLGDFLNVRETRFKPNDKAISDLKRIDKIDFSGEIFISDKPSNTNMILVKNGDLVISGINVEKGAMAVYTGEEDITATIHYSSYSFDENKIDIEFLKYFLKSNEFKNALKEQVPGGIKTEIKSKHLLPLQVKIPVDIKDQKAVVEILKSRNLKVESLSNELSHQLTLVKKLRQQLLQDAVQGKLVPRNPNDEPASELLKKIKAEKATLRQAKGTNKKEKELPPIKAEEIPFEIPEGWVWCRLGEIALKSEAGTSYQAEGIKALENEWAVIKTSAITSGCFLAEENKRLPNQKDNFDKIEIKIGDLLFCRASGSKGLAGKSCLVDSEMKAKLVLSDKTIRYYFSNSISKIFIHLYNSSLYGEIYYQNLGTKKSTTMNNITREQFNNLQIPLPPFFEQLRIVKRVDELMQTCDALEASIKASAAQNEKLLQQVLREALRKEVVAV